MQRNTDRERTPRRHDDGDHERTDTPYERDRAQWGGGGPYELAMRHPGLERDASYDSRTARQPEYRTPEPPQASRYDHRQRDASASGYRTAGYGDTAVEGGRYGEGRTTYEGRWYADDADESWLAEQGYPGGRHNPQRAQRHIEHGPYPTAAQQGLSLTDERRRGSQGRQRFDRERIGRHRFDDDRLDDRFDDDRAATGRFDSDRFRGDAGRGDVGRRPYPSGDYSRSDVRWSGGADYDWLPRADDQTHGWSAPASRARHDRGRDTVRDDERRTTGGRFDSDTFAQSRFGYGAERPRHDADEGRSSGQRDDRPHWRQRHGYRNEPYGEIMERDYLDKMRSVPNADDLGPEFQGEQPQGRQLRDQRQSRGQHHQDQPARRGQHAGRGPKNYHRSDERIREDVCDRLSQHGDIDASDVDVSVHDGEVTLGGSVESRQMRWLAEEVAEFTSGVRDVMNQLHVRQRGHQSGGHDADRATTASSTPIGHTYQGLGQNQGNMVGTGGLDMSYRGAATEGAADLGGALGTHAGRDTGGMPVGMGTGSDVGLMGSSAGRGTGAFEKGRSGDVAGAAMSPSGAETSSATVGSGASVGGGTATTGGTAATGGAAKGASAASRFRSQIHESMEVVGTDGEGIGTVNAVQPQGFVVSRPARTTLRVPFDAIKTVDGDRIMLSCRADQVDAQGWPVPRAGRQSS